MADEGTAAVDTQEPAAASAPAEAASEPASKPPPPAAAAAASSSSAPEKSAAATANIEFEPPAACIRRLLKQALPKSTNVSKDSLAAISRASGIFVLYLTACANDVAREGRRTTIVAKDVLGALKELEFGDFVPLMEKFLEGHRKEEKNKKEEKERMKKAQAQAAVKKDASTGKFVKGGGDDINKEEAGKKGGDGNDGKPEAVTSKNAREDEGGEKDGEPAAKKQKTNVENDDREE